MPWVQLIGAFVGAASKPINVSAPDPSQYQLQSNPGPIIFGAILGTAAIGGLVYLALKR